MALTEQALTTVAAMRAYITRERTAAATGLLDDEHMEQVIAMASSAIAMHCQRQLRAPAAAITYTLDGTGGTTLYLPEWPIVSIASITNLSTSEVIPARTTPTGLGWSASDADRLAGIVRLTGYSLDSGSAMVSVSARLGYDATTAASTPATQLTREHQLALTQLEQACLAWGALLHSASVPSVETLSIEGGGAFTVREQAIPTRVRKLLEPFVRVTVA